MKIAFYDTKKYDIPAFESYGKRYGIEIKFFETKLNEDTVGLAEGYEDAYLLPILGILEKTI